MLTRGSKTAAEKVVRDSDMGSPDRREPIPPVADMQDSPLFKFLCELSPIQPAKTVHHAQTYNELTFPQEHRVFASPRSASRRSSTSALKRCVSAQAEGRESLGWGTMSRSTVCGSPSPLNRRSDETPCSRRQSGEAEVKVEPPSGEEDEKKPPSPELSEKVSDVGERRQSTTSSCVIASQESRCLPDGEDPRRMSMGCSSGHGLSYSPVPKGSPELDRETTAMAYFLAGNQELGRGNEEWSEDSSEVVVPRLPNEMVRRQEGEMLDAITPQSGLGTCSEDGQDAITSQNVGQQQGLLSNRGESSGQRGFRRRCLDFDASVARRKSLGSMGGRKGVGSRLKDCSASTAAADDSNAVGNVAPTSPDASSGKVQQGRMNDFANANDSSRAASESGTYTRGDSLGTMTRMQFTGGSYRKTADVPHAKGEAQTPTSQKSGAASAVVPAAGLRRSPRVRPTGIGLHLNSLASAVPFKREYPSSGGADSSKGVLATVLGLQPMPCPSPKENPCGGSAAAAGYGGVSQAFNPGTVGSLSEMDMNKLEGASVMNNRVSIPAPDFRCLNLESLSALEESLSLTPGASGLSHVVSPRGHKRCQEELMRAAQAEGDTMDDLLDSPQSSKRRRLSRRKSTVTTQSDKSGDGCKRCNCRKSKCLKLYCECFAAGVYCVGSCACRDCFNKPEYEETVINTRHQIESRNPLAFAPKIVQTAESSPGPGDEALDTPASARHKRGCNCKKSLCLKKYCECYQAGVGCSEGCRCEGCKNMYGRKEGPEVDDKEGEQLVNSGREETSQADDPIELLNRMSGKSDRLRDSAKANLSPITPTFEHDGHGRPMLRLRSMGRNKRGGSGISEEHCGSPLADPASRPPMSPTRFSQALQDGFHLVPYAQQGDSDFSMSAAGDSPMTTPTFARIDHASPRWEGLGDLCTLTPLPLAQLRPTPGSSCVTTVDRPGASPAFSSHMTESPYHAGSSTSVHQRVAPRQWSPHEDSSSRFRQPAPRSPLRFDTPRQSQQQLSDQCHSTTTPPTPSMPLHQPPLQLLSGRNLQSELESAKVVADDDGTPEFLKYADCSESFGSPSRSTVTKSHSPKQKRVTPPRYGGGRAYREPGGNIPQSSLARRFILQALPQPTPSYPNG